MKLPIIAAVLAAILALPIHAAENHVVQKFGFGIAGDTTGGCDLPDVHVSYARDVAVDDETPPFLTAKGRVRQGGNRACRSATSADIAIQHDFGDISVELGYDLRGVSFSGPSYEGVGDAIFYGSMNAATAVVSYDVDLGGVNGEIGYNIPGEAPRVALSWRHGTLSAEGDVSVYDAGALATFKGAWTRTFGDQWGVEAFVSYTHGIDNAPDPVTWKSDQGFTPADPPVSTYSFGAGVVWTPE